MHRSCQLHCIVFPLGKKKNTEALTKRIAKLNRSRRHSCPIIELKKFRDKLWKLMICFSITSQESFESSLAGFYEEH